MVRITNDAEGKVVIGLLEIERGRQAEKDGVHYVLTEMLGYEPLVEHNEDGKPMIEGYHISISHTLGYADTKDKLIAWCAKETMYKLFSSELLSLKDIKVDPQSSLVTNMKRNITLKFQCECSSKYILTYTWY